MNTVRTPFTPSQVESLNAFQNGPFHEFTCGNDACPVNQAVLIAGQDGWLCPICGYRQYWAHSFMADWSWKKTQE